MRNSKVAKCVTVKAKNYLKYNFNFNFSIEKLIQREWLVSGMLGTLSKILLTDSWIFGIGGKNVV